MDRLSEELDFLHANFSGFQGGLVFHPDYFAVTSELLDAMFAEGP